MPITKKIREQMLALCGSICSDDGLDAKTQLRRDRESGKSQTHRRMRLCEQVGRTLRLVVPATAADVELVKVLPARDGATLRVLFRPATNRDDLLPQRQYLDQLQEQEGWLRSEVAGRISRKRVPHLRFEFINEEDCHG